MNKSTGSILVLALPTILILFAASLFFVNMSHLQYQQFALQTKTDAVLLSALRLRGEGLHRVSNRWSNVGVSIQSGNSNSISVDPARWLDLQNQADALKRAIPGYKGRIKAVAGVVAQANGLNKNDVLMEKSDGLSLGIEPEGISVSFKDGADGYLHAGWYRRTWSLLKKGPFSLGSAQVVASTRVPLIGVRNKIFVLKQRATGQLGWEANQENAVVQSVGNGGYPRTWQEALVGNAVDPHRYPYYFSELTYAP